MMRFKYLVAFLTLIFTISCGQDFNSNSYDGAGNRSCPDPGDANLCASLKIIQTSCISCHTGEHSAWFNFQSKSDFINAGLIDPSGDINFSALITNLKRYGSGGDMPLTPYTLSQPNYEILVNWVESP